MQRRSNINLNSAGKLSCLLLLLVLGGVFCPLSSTSTYAEEGDNNTDASTAAEMGDEYSTATYGNEVEERTSTESSVGIAFSNTEPSSGSISVNNTVLPVKEENLTQANVLVTISAQKAKSYEVYLGSTSSDLVNKIGEEEYTIEGLTDADVSYESIPKNKWGYSVSTEKNVVSDSYNRVPKTSETAHIIASNPNPSDIDPDYLTLSFAANIGNDMPSGTYSNTVTLSVVSTPREVTLMDIDTMQEMTAKICEASDVSIATDATTSTNQAQLRDTRDGKYYWVGKMPDDRCWMTQNLDLDLFASDGEKADGQQHKKTTLTSKDSNVTADWSPNSDTIVTATTAPTDDNGQLSWSMSGQLGDTDYYTANPDSVKSCGTQVTNIQSCSANDVGKWTLSSVPKSANNDPNAHRLLGNFYSWGAATAGATDETVPNAGDNAPQSICPLGWRLPTSGEDGEFQLLSNALGATEGAATTGTVSKFTDAPFYAVRGGFISTAGFLFNVAGNSGYGWSSTASGDTTAYRLYFYSTGGVYPSNSSSRRYGYPVRCINDLDI